MTLRISHLIVQAVLVNDDGEELSPGPELQPIRLARSQVASFIDGLPAEVAALEAKLAQPLEEK